MRTLLLTLLLLPALATANPCPSLVGSWRGDVVGDQNGVPIVGIVKVEIKHKPNRFYWADYKAKVLLIWSGQGGEFQFARFESRVIEYYQSLDEGGLSCFIDFWPVPANQRANGYPVNKNQIKMAFRFTDLGISVTSSMGRFR